MSTKANLLVELLTEELPPKALARLAETFAAGVHAGLGSRSLATAATAPQWFATPRRLVVRVLDVQAQAPDVTVQQKIMPVPVAIDASGKPTPALLKKLEAMQIPVSEVPKFEKRPDGKSETFYYQASVKGAKLDDVLAGIVAEALKKLPIPKVMRWGDTDHQFVRPVHGLVLLHGDRVVPGEVLGQKSGRVTRGHRFLSQGTLSIPSADAYFDLMEKQGKVVVCFTTRRKRIQDQLDARAAELHARINPSEGLLDEVTSLVEWPMVYVSEFESEYLEVPQECLILTMQQNQKYFPLLDSKGKLLNKFLIVSNMEVPKEKGPRHIVEGNARVVRPRLSDARFFFNQDRKVKLAARLEKLGSVVYYKQLGTQLQRVERLEALARKIADRLGANTIQAARAARLAKADLVTDMVGEFPELQGIMGRYYAIHDGEDREVADAIQAHYQPRFAGDAIPQGQIAASVALADKLDAMDGLFGIGQIPTGDKDPFGLRRAALGVLRILIETPLPLKLDELIDDSAKGFAAGVLGKDFEGALYDFVLDRLRGYLRDAGHSPDAIEAVLAQKPARMDQIPAKLEAVRSFQKLPEAQALAAANKRIGNILKKATEVVGKPDPKLLKEDAEKALFERVLALEPVVKANVQGGDYSKALLALAGMRAEVDHFFDKVVVMAEDAQLRANRLGLLKTLYEQLNAVADISRLAVEK